MRKLQEVQEAKELMNKAMEWSAFKWLFEKSRVRETADRANAVLERLERSVKSHWSEEMKAVYKHASAKHSHAERLESGEAQPNGSIDSEMMLLIGKLKATDEAARRARNDAETIFDEAEKKMSTTLAREGCKKAIHSWELHEKAIRQAEAVGKTGKTEE